MLSPTHHWVPVLQDTYNNQVLQEDQEDPQGPQPPEPRPVLPASITQYWSIIAKTNRLANSLYSQTIRLLNSQLSVPHVPPPFDTDVYPARSPMDMYHAE